MTSNKPNGGTPLLGRNTITAKHIIADLAKHADDIENVCIVAFDKKGRPQVLMNNQPVGNIAFAAAVLQDRALAPMRQIELKRQMAEAQGHAIRQQIGDPRAPANK